MKLNSLKKKQPKQSDNRRKNKNPSIGLRNIVHEDHIDLDIDDPPISISPDNTASTPTGANNYGALANTSTNLFQQENDDKPENFDMSTDQEAPNPTIEGDNGRSRVNQAYTNDLI